MNNENLLKKCPNCGAVNNLNSTFCMQCGNAFTEQNISAQNQFSNVIQNQNSYIQNQNVSQQPTINDAMDQGMVQSQNIVYNNQMNKQTVQMVSNTSNNLNLSLNYFEYLVVSFLRPDKTFKQENDKLNNPKNSILLGVIVSVIMTLISTVKSMISVVRVTTGGWLTETKTTWEWSNLKELNYIKLIGQDLLIYLGIIFGVALVFYLASLVIKKQTSYPKFVAITATSLIPYTLGGMILTPLLSNISIHVGVVVSIVSIVYSLVIFNNNIDSELNLEGDKKVYFNLICYTMVLLIGYFILVKYINSVFSGFGLGSSGSYGLDSFLDY